ncbi:outer membrane beta-barrel protein [Sphingobium sp. AN641]|uniref:outer membrane protein n=1 Tax=Sphingobium sp. AN641 TaxID=3133443 RepID=UPI0030BEB42A
MKSLALASFGAIIALASPAMAQDGTDHFSGPYVGASLGYNWLPNNTANDVETLAYDTNGDGNFNDQPRNAVTGANAFVGYCDGRPRQRPNGTVADGCTSDRDGKFAYSGMLGYDMQMGNVVIGAVVEGGQSYGSNYVTGFSSTPANYTFSRRLDWEAAARLRAGFAFDRTLVYATGGLAYGKFKNNFTTNNGANTFTESNRTEDDWGYTFGGGIEHKVDDHFSVGVLYRYTRFNPNDYRVTVGQGTAPAGNPFINGLTNGSTVIMRTNEQYTTQSVRFTAAYRF